MESIQESQGITRFSVKSNLKTRIYMLSTIIWLWPKNMA